MNTFFSLFSGLGGADRGLTNLGLTSLGGVEYNKALVDIFNRNHRKKIPVINIMQLREIPQADLVWVSPPCQSFSFSNLRRKELTHDLALARQIIKLLETANPTSIVIENVVGYAKSVSFEIISQFLIEQGYQLQTAVVNCELIGLPTTRKRFFCRASKKDIKPLRTIRRRQSWYSAIEPFQNQLKPTQLTIAQQRRIASTKPDSDTFLIERCGYYHTPRLIPKDNPAPTIRSHISHDGKGSFRTAYNIVREGLPYKADLTCLAAWQDLTSFDLGLDPVAAAIGIGNAVPPKLASYVASSVL